MGRTFAVLLTLAVAATAVVVVDSLSRRLVEQQLSERLTEAPARAANELANLTRQATPLGEADSLRELTAAAVADDTRVALAAQRQVEELLQSWRYARPRLSDERLLAKASRLAAALRATGPGAEANWVATMARRLLLLADGREGESMPLVDDCEAVLLAASEAPRRITPAIEDRPPYRDPIVTTPAPKPQTPTAAVAAPDAEPLRITLGSPAEPPTTTPAAPPSPWLSEDSQPTPPRSLARAETAPPASDWKPDWSPPVDSNPGQPQPTAEPAVPAPPAESLDGLSDRELLTRFLPIAVQASRSPAAVGPGGRLRSDDAGQTDDSPESRLRQAVVDRGYGGVSTRHVRLLLSDRVGDRQTLANQLLTSPSSGATRLLLLLAADASPSVRHDALRALGSSSDARVVDAAWRMAIKDRDPRVARLADELQQLR